MVPGREPPPIRILLRHETHGGPDSDRWAVPGPWICRSRAFRSLQPKLYPGARDLEVIDIYALTLREDAGLELHQVEVLPGEVRR
ncbi:MAG: hypothetical protein ACKPGI_09825 [Verrucomicrobiota bacterium]